MSIEIKVPQLPESVSDATLVAWHKSVGDSVARDENLVDLETDKVVLEVPAPAAGILAKIVVEDGATVVAGDVLAILETRKTRKSRPGKRRLNRRRKRDRSRPVRRCVACWKNTTSKPPWFPARARMAESPRPM
jgi:pyruvate/2-oxoglutarate dehydrogenase complex dihydrolipoamide acyltransferase (E2) component